jgi:acyl-coenzyme A synthetase/AMP-(fatty) acid ligase
LTPAEGRRLGGDAAPPSPSPDPAPVTGHLPGGSLDALLTDRASRFGDHVYLQAADAPRRLTFGGLDRLTHQVGRFLAARGIRRDDRVSVLAENGPGLVGFFFGIQRYGAAVNPINVEVNAKNVAQILHDVEPRLVLWSQTLAEELRATVAASGVETVPFDPDDLGPLLDGFPPTPDGGGRERRGRFAVIDYTSGTTSRPKGVCITHEAFAHMCDSPRQRFGIARGDRVLEYRSLAWASPQLLSLGATLHAGAVVVLGRRFSQHRFFDWIREHGITIAVGVPTVIHMLLERPREVTAASLPSLRFITSSSAPLTVDRQRDFERRYGIPVVQGCGMTEAGFMAGNPPGASRPGSIGLPMPHLRAWFRDDAGMPCPPGVEGELLVAGPQMASAYLTGRGRLEPIPADGFPTGDLGYADEAGYLHLTGRKKDVIIRGGVNIAPLEITAALLAHPGVADAATIGVPDRVYGEAAVSFVVPRAGAAVTSSALLAHCGEHLASFKVPAHIVVVDAIPRTDRGKVARDALDALWRTAAAGG